MTIVFSCLDPTARASEPGRGYHRGAAEGGEMLQVGGVNYPAIIVRNMQESIEFYERLGMQALYLEPNRDDAESVTAMLHAGGDSFVLLVGPVEPGRVSIAQASPGVGSMQYLSLQLPLEQMREIHHRISNAGVHGSEEIERGFERLVFLEDPNGVLITLTAWATEPPPDLPRARVLERAAALREAEGAPFIEDAHVRRAIEELEAGG
jgi:catechol 2,3-dioxygenase-like lactoylglutathione lyase family enzyme